MADEKELKCCSPFSPDKRYMWYTTCPQCSKKYGKNYVVIVAKVS